MGRHGVEDVGRRMLSGEFFRHRITAWPDRATEPNSRLGQKRRWRKSPLSAFPDHKFGY